MKKHSISFVCILFFSPFQVSFTEAGKNDPKLRKVNAILLKAAETGNIATVRNSLRDGADANTTNKDGNTPLMWAAEKGHIEIVKLLIEAKADVNAKEKDGWTALIEASAGGHLKIAAMLIEFGAEINAAKANGETALMLAANNGHEEFVKMLLSKGAAVNAKREDGNTALMRASSNGHTEIVKILIEKRADVNAKEKGWATALTYATAGGHLAVLQVLIAEGANVNAQDDAGLTALKLALLSGKTEVVELLKKSGANVDKAFEEELLMKRYQADLSKINAPYVRNFKAKQKKSGSCLKEHTRMEEDGDAMLFINDTPESEAVAVYAKKNFKSYLLKREKVSDQHERHDLNTLKILPCGKILGDRTYKTKLNVVKSVSTLQAEYLIIVDVVTDQELLFD
jgi:ankyrin repeat protein